MAEWVLKNNKHAGATTNTLPGARCLYLSIRGAGNGCLKKGMQFRNGLCGCPICHSFRPNERLWSDAVLCETFRLNGTLLLIVFVKEKIGFHGQKVLRLCLESIVLEDKQERRKKFQRLRTTHQTQLAMTKVKRAVLLSKTRRQRS